MANIPNKEVGICRLCGRHQIIFDTRNVVCYNCFSRCSRIKQRRKILAKQTENGSKDDHKVDIKI